ncbi:MAG TPA: carbohydrate ABC transporter permease [Clostridiales bacterium]|nr:carbohydrate ABC transporter permease [Clostridiales bacterium]
MKKYKVINFLLIALVSLIGILVAFPIFWMIRSSLVSKAQFFSRPPVIWPSKMLFSNFTKAMERIDFGRQLWNSVSIVVPYVIGNVITCSISAYAFARIEFPLKKLWFACIISTMMLPSAVTLIPQYTLYTKFGWVGTDALFNGKLPLIVPAFLCSGGNAYFLFLLRQFFVTIPKELDEAARMDGAGHFRIYSTIMLPLIRPAIIVVALFSFINSWNEFFYTLIYLQGEKSYTLTLGLYIVNGMKISNYEQVMALAIIVTSPCLLFFLIGNKYFTEGITFTGIKG